MLIPDAFTQRIKQAFAVPGENWLASLPCLISHCEQRYGFKLEQWYTQLSFNLVAKARSVEGVELVVKFCLPSHEVAYERLALEQLAGDGIVQLLVADEQNGMLILERLLPGRSLLTVEDDAIACEIAADVMSRLWRRPTIPLDAWPTTGQWLERLSSESAWPAVVAPAMLERARGMAAELHQSMDSPLLLHGDLHHANILAAKRQAWLAIDPKGVIGEPAFEVSAFLRNPIPHIASRPALEKYLSKRMDVFAERLMLDRQRIQAWGFVGAMLATAWSIDAQSSDWRLFLACAQAMQAL